MKIEIDDSLISKIGIDEQEALELLAIALYKYKGVHGSLAGKLIGKSEFDFHSLVSEKGETINYSVDDLVDDIKNNDL
jgi:predicted HTH domain antitoxin